jgi:hypothetical protein
VSEAAEVDLRKQISDQALEIARLLKINDALIERATYREWLRITERLAVFERLLGEALRNNYINETRCPKYWLREAKKEITL